VTVGLTEQDSGQEAESDANMTWPVFHEPTDDDTGDAGGDEHNPDRCVAMPTRIADSHLGAIVESYDDNQSDDRCRNQQPDDPAELSPALDDDIAASSLNNCFACHDAISLPPGPHDDARKIGRSNSLWKPETAIVVIAGIRCARPP